MFGSFGWVVGRWYIMDKGQIGGRCVKSEWRVGWMVVGGLDGWVVVG